MVVGYQTSPISGYQMKTPTFKNVSTANYPIDSFTVQGATDGVTTIQVLDTAGQMAGIYYWYNEFIDGTTTYPAGWFDASGAVPAEIELAPGEAVFFNTNEEGVTIRSAGEVPGEISHPVSGYMMLGNGSPVTIDVDDMAVEGATDGVTTIQVLDSAGQMAGIYYWYNEFIDGTTTYPAGWFDASGAESANFSLDPGEAVFFNSNESGVTVTIPSAL